MRGLFVVGTDTGVGKTFVSAALCRAARRTRRRVAGLKPYETGFRLATSDATALEREAKSGLPLELRCPFRFSLPVAPAVAAVVEGRRPSVEAAAAVVREVGRKHFVVVESAGGLASPINGLRTNLDLAEALGLPVVLVGRDALGTLNHTALAVEALRARQLRIRGIVLSRGSSTVDPSQATNAAWVARLTQARKVIALPRSSVSAAARRLASLIR